MKPYLPSRLSPSLRNNRLLVSLQPVHSSSSPVLWDHKVKADHPHLGQPPRKVATHSQGHVLLNRKGVAMPLDPRNRKGAAMPLDPRNSKGAVMLLGPLNLKQVTGVGVLPALAALGTGDTRVNVLAVPHRVVIARVRAVSVLGSRVNVPARVPAAVINRNVGLLRRISG